MSTRLPNLAKIDYAARVNRAIDHVLNNLAGSLRLEEVAAVAHFSPFHFHRIFKALTGETLGAFVRRVRLERALYLMSHGSPPSLTQVALECGFSSSSDFSRSFKQHFGTSPSTFDLATWRDEKRGRLQDSIPSESGYRLDRIEPGENPDGFVAEIRALPARRVVYSRVFDPFRPHVVMDAAAELVEWAERHGVAGGQWLGYMWEDPEIVDLELCRYDVGIEVPHGFEPGVKRGVTEFPEMIVAHVPCSGSIEVEQRAIDWTYGTWLPSSGYVPADQPAFEAWNGRPFAHGTDYFDLALELPVRRA